MELFLLAGFLKTWTLTVLLNLTLSLPLQCSLASRSLRPAGAAILFRGLMPVRITTFSDEKGRVCTKCGEYKTWNHFSACTRANSGHHERCNACKAEYDAAHREHRLARQREFYASHRDEKRKAQRDYNAAHRTRVLQNQRKYNAAHREERLAYIANNRERARELDRKRQRKLRLNPIYRLNQAISLSMRHTLLEGKAGRHWETLVDYNLDQLKRHLEFFFESGMTWDNYGEWQIDHVKPRSSFCFARLKDKAIRKCWALKNLMPRWRSNTIANAHGSNQLGNTEKGNRSINDLQPMLDV